MEKDAPTPTPDASTSGKTEEPFQGSGSAGRRVDVVQTLASLPIDIGTIADPVVRQAMTVLLNLVERLSAENAALREENQNLKDQINRLKGEQGKPDVKPGKKKDGDISSEKERRSRNKPKQGKKRGPKRDKIEIHQTKVCPVDPATLPPDVEFKGYESVVVQDLQVVADNIEFKKEVYYSPSQNKTYMAGLPDGYIGEYGPGIRSMVISLKYICGMSEPKILEFLREHNVIISAATISRMLTEEKDLAVFHQEKTDLFRAGLEVGPYQQIDDTAARVNGENWYTQIVCNELYAAFFTTQRKDRLTILDVLRQFESRQFVFNDEAVGLLEAMRVPQYVRQKLVEERRDVRLTEPEIDSLLAAILPDPEKNKLHRIRIKEATAIAAYHQETGIPVVEILFSDDAPQFKLLTKELGLCWIHDGRHYKKLRPVVPYHAQMLASFRERYWDFYAELLTFKEHPSAEEAAGLSEEFDQLFTTETGYEDLDERIAKTRAKKGMLLLVLRHPEVPLHNNAAELEARVVVRRRDVCLHTRSENGTKACDTMTTIVRTSQKLGLSAFEYIRDRVSRCFRFPSLADLIRTQAATPSADCGG